jgi:hypothetical protein
MPLHVRLSCMGSGSVCMCHQDAVLESTKLNYMHQPTDLQPKAVRPQLLQSILEQTEQGQLKYPSVYVAGHSLGSEISYDAT